MRQLFILLFLSFSLFSSAQDAYERYIEKYYGMAIDQMNRYGIPASITLAQGLLESGAGKSYLALKANNHFGIKAHNGWTGRTIKKKDDSRHDRFRVYSSVADSYEDHSKFLVNNSRYAALFELERDDYAGWAKGLKRAGYATHPRYAYKLIDIIERYQRDRYDVTRSPVLRIEHEVRMCNKNYYIVAREGDTFKSIAKEMGVRARKLRRYNEVEKNHVIRPGDIIYLEEKRSRADRSLKGFWHTVEAGETVHSLSQRYGIKMKTIYKKNGLTEEYRPTPGDRLRIR